jgi:type IV pilus assembly protein PilM
MKSAYDGAKKKNADYRKELENLMVAGSQRTPWLAVLKAINECLPRDILNEEIEQQDPTLKNRIRILSITARQYPDLSEWYKGLTDDKKKWMRSQKENNVEVRAKPDDQQTAPSGAGFVFTLQGRHFHQDPNDISMKHVSYVASTFLKNLQEWEVPQLSVTARGPTGLMIPVRKMGISHAIIAESQPLRSVIYYKNGPASAAAARAAGGVAGGGDGGPPGMAGRGGGTMGRGGIPGMGGAMPGSTYGAKARNRPGAKSKSARNAKVDPAGLDESQEIPLTDFVVEFVWKDIPEEKQQPADPNPLKAPPGTGGGTGAAPGQPMVNAPGGPTTTSPGMPNSVMPATGSTATGANPAALPGTTPGANGPPTGGAAPAGATPAGPKPN